MRKNTLAQEVADEYIDQIKKGLVGDILEFLKGKAETLGVKNKDKFITESLKLIEIGLAVKCLGSPSPPPKIDFSRLKKEKKLEKERLRWVNSIEPPESIPQAAAFERIEKKKGRKGKVE